ncbi:MAG: 2-oxo acid dehydrogenase subunit E2, partial [Cellulomonas sp.]|nr:2-oxo acid dehydrogenase subunit E2 [Cellulomonas sp.]
MARSTAVLEAGERPVAQKADPASLRAEFGANEWLVDELYEQYQQDPSSVDPAWWEFFEGYRPLGPQGQASEARKVAATQAPPAPGTTTSGVNGAATTTSPTVPATGNGHAAPAATPAPAAPVTEPPTTTSPIAEAQPPTAAYAQPVITKLPGHEGTAEAADEVQRLRGPAARLITNMEASLEIPTATSVRTVPAKLMVDNRIVVNNQLTRRRSGKVSFTHLIGFAVVEAVADMPVMNSSYTLQDGKPAVLTPAHVNLGIAIDLEKPDGSRQLLVPSIKKAETLDFLGFWNAYEDVVRRARAGKLTVEDFQGTTISLTNPGTLGTVHSVPRLMTGQGTIVGVGAMDYPAEFAGTSEDRLNAMGVSKVLTLTSTYDHRIIQGAQSGDFLRIVANKLISPDFWDRVFASLKVPYEPVRWVRDATSDPDSEAIKPARIFELIHAYRSRGHLMADTDPLAYRQRKHPDLDVQNHGLTLWDLDRSFPTGGFTGKPRATLRDILGLLRDSYCRTVGVEYMHLQDPRQRRWLQERLEAGHARTAREDQ